MNNKDLLETDEVLSLVNQPDVTIIDTRDERVYQKAHIPNAISIPQIFTYLCTNETGGHAKLVKDFSELLSNKGVKTTDRIVVYEDAMDNGYGQSCRGWFILNFLGHLSQVSVLHGGYKAWFQKKLPLSTDVPQRQATMYTPTVNHSLIINSEQMLKAIGDPNIVIVDVRDYAEWIGANSSPYGYDYCPRKGRIPGARWLEWYRLMTRHEGIPWFRKPDEILSAVQQANIPLEKQIYVYCFKGARTSNVALALKTAGIYVKNYFNSWNEWSRDLNLPIEEDYPNTFPDQN
jgi:thiosulfate/3-mercaptopyruvate sulfurtransferase